MREVDYVDIDFNSASCEQPTTVVCRLCESRLQHVEGRLLPCASCFDPTALYYVVMKFPMKKQLWAPKKPWYFPQSKPEPVRTEEIVLTKRAYQDTHFPNRRAAFWWYDHV